MDKIIKELTKIITNDVIKQKGYWIDQTTFYCAVNIDKRLFDELNSLDGINCCIENYDDSQHIAIEYWADDPGDKIVYVLTSDVDECNITKLLQPYFDCIVMKGIAK